MNGIRTVRTYFSIRDFICYIFVFLPVIAGCAIPQPPGRGNQFLMQEIKNHREYYLYLPSGFTTNRKWPMVLTLHGMKPFDSAPAQAREWQDCADRYGFVIVAPILLNSDLFMQYPMTNITNGVREDEARVLEIVNEVSEHCNVDRKRIYATSWSSGGYLLHYIVNHHPDLFAAMCARGSCFSDSILSIDNAKKMAAKHFPVMIYYCENDLAGVRRESEEALTWYKSLGFPVSSNVVPGKGHERVPDLAAQFFAKNNMEPVSTAQSVEIHADASVGMSPFTVNLQAVIPNLGYGEYRKYNFSWYVDNALQDQAQGFGKKTLFTTLYAAGEHTVRVEVQTPSSQRLNAASTLRVLPTVPSIK
jgi:poly(3-hydroxybutyrate) depolymerase